MANAPNAPIPATGAAQGAPPSPEAPPAQQPFALPDGMTAEAAHQRIHELQQDREFGQRWLASGNDSPEGRLMDALQHRALNQQPAVATPELTDNDRAIA